MEVKPKHYSICTIFVSSKAMAGICWAPRMK
ncbi:hypothetical protein EMIT0P176_310022 [Pseudomonas sp. IT-P176]